MSLISWEIDRGIWLSLRPCFICCGLSSFKLTQKSDEVLEVTEEPCGGGCSLIVHCIFFPYYILGSIFLCDNPCDQLSNASASKMKFIKNPDKSVDCQIKTKSGFKNGEVFIKNVVKAKANIDTSQGKSNNYNYSQLELVYQEEDLQRTWETVSKCDGDECKQNRVKIVVEKINDFIRNVSNKELSPAPIQADDISCQV
jgi:hypothetical protein